MKEQRIDEMEMYILKNRTASIEELCEHFEVSINTVRRDISALLQRGNVKKIYGGVTAVQKEEIVGLRPYSERNIKNSETKAILAKKAAQFVKNNDVIYIDTGSTTVGIIDNLADKKNVTVITNSVSVIIKALNLDNIRLIAIPGLLDRKVAALIGPQAVESLKNYNINKAFLTCTAFSIKGGVMNSTPEEYTIKQTAMSNSMEVYLLADKDKFGKHSLMTYAQIGDFDYFITDMQKNAKFSKYLAEHRTKLIPI